MKIVLALVLFAFTALAADSSAAAKIDALLSRYNQLGIFNGSSLVADNGQVVAKKGYGMANFEWNIPNGVGPAQSLRFYVGVDNAFDQHPPLSILATGAGPGAVGNAGTYDIRGRTFYGGFRARF